MAFANFSITTVYTAIITALNAQLTAVASLFKDQTTGDFTGQIRISSSGKRIESWSGSAWVAVDLSFMTTNYSALTGTVPTWNQSTTGNATTATTAANVTKAVIDALGIAASTATTATNSSGTGTTPVTSETGLKIIRGVVAANGSLVVGSGFTCSRSATGVYSINFTSAFSAGATVVLTPMAEGGVLNLAIVSLAVANVSNVTSYADVKAYRSSTAADNRFGFIAIGPS